MSFQAVKTWKESNDPDFEVKKNRILELYDIADGKTEPGPGDPAGGDLRRRVRTAEPATPSRASSGRPSAASTPILTGRRGGGDGRPTPGPTVSAICSPAMTCRPTGSTGTSSYTRDAAEFLAFCRYLRSLHPPEVRIAIVLDNFSPHLSTKKDQRVGRVGGGQQRRARLHTALRLMAQPDRSPIPGAALLRPRRHRSSQPPRAGPNDPPLHRLAQPQRPRPGTT